MRERDPGLSGEDPQGSWQQEPCQQEPGQQADAMLARLAGLARTQHGHAPLRGERTFERVTQALHARRARRRWLLAGVGPQSLRWGVPIAALGALGLFAWFGSPLGTPASLGYEVSGAVAMQSGEIVGGEQSRLSFTDGSALTLSRGARARVASLDARGGQIELSEGHAQLSIVKRQSARWQVHAGPYKVRVTGTAFDVRWQPADRTFELTMQEGEVHVSGPLLDGAVRLKAGQRVHAALDASRVVIGDVDDGHGDLADAAASGEAGELVEVEIHPPEPPASRERLRERPQGAGKSPWAKRLVRGEFNGILREAERLGLERVLANAPLHDLSALADAARFTRKPDLARRALLAARRRFPQSAVAADAAFLLGRLAAPGGGEASEEAAAWYGRYLRESPRGPYAAQALGRRMLYVYRAQGADAARLLAQRYLERHPGGPYTGSARRISGEAALAPGR